MATQKDEQPKKGNQLAGIGIGICFGVAIGVALGNIAIGIAIGVIFGLEWTGSVGRKTSKAKVKDEDV